MYFIDEDGRTDLIVSIKDRIKWLDFCDTDKRIINKERTWAIKECFIKEYRREGKRVIVTTRANNNFLVGDFESEEEAIVYMKRLATGVLG